MPVRNFEVETDTEDLNIYEKQPVVNTDLRERSRRRFLKDSDERLRRRWLQRRCFRRCQHCDEGRQDPIKQRIARTELIRCATPQYGDRKL